MERLRRAELGEARAARRSTTTLRSAVLASLASLALFFLLDGLLFHSGFYSDWLEPDSSAGEVEGHMHWFANAPEHRHEVVVVGDSRIAEGFSARVATSAAGGRIHFTNFGIPGSTARVNFYMVRDADPDRTRFDAVVIAVPQYSDQDGGEDGQNRTTDLNYLVGRLAYTDCPTFASSFLEPELRHTNFAGCLFRGIPLRSDIQAMLHNVRGRVRAARDWMQHGQGYINGYDGKPEDVRGLSADFTARTISFPPGLKDWQTSSIRNTVLPAEEPQTGRLTEYRRQWMGAIVELYRGTKTRVVFLELPRAPLNVPEARTPARFIDEIARNPQVSVLPKTTFRDLEDPNLFADGLHLNHAGRPIFSARVSQRVEEVLSHR